jgi:putative ABC transport system permease protein
VPGIVVPAVYIAVPRYVAPLEAVLSPELAQQLELEPAEVGLVVEGPISVAAEADIREAAGAVSPKASIYVERGYQGDDEAAIILAVLAAVGALLMLGGTLTATSLALSDAKPDLATLAAVGAAPRTRRAVAAAYAGTIGLTGAVLGAAVGFIPGIAITYPLTSVTWINVDAEGRALPDHFLDIPWLLLGGIVVLLPLCTALLVGLTVRSRLPLVSRVD